MFTEKLLLIRVDFFTFGKVFWIFSITSKAYRIVFIFEAAWLRGVVLPNPFRGMEKQKNFAATKQFNHTLECRHQRQSEYHETVSLATIC